MTFISNVPGNVSVVTMPTPTVELAVPFDVGPDGLLATTADPAQKAAQHLISLALTAPGERVMRSTYGIGVSRMVFENATLDQFQRVAQTLQSAFQMAEAGVSNISVTVIQTVGDRYLFKINFTLDQSPILHEAVFDYSGNLVGSS